MPSTTLTLTYEDTRAQILWDTKNEIPAFVEIELSDNDGRPPITEVSLQNAGQREQVRPDHRTAGSKQTPAWPGGLCEIMNHNSLKTQVPSRLLITSWNVRGLNDQLRKLKVKDFVKKEKPLILALQETKLTNNRMTIAATNIAPSYTMVASQGRNGGRTALLLHPLIALKDSSRLSDGNLTWAQVDYQAYKNLMVGEEQHNFRSLKLKFTLSDAFDVAEERKGPHYTRHIAYGAEFRWATLDWIYLPTDAPWFEAVESINHQADYTLSDHMPVSVLLALGGRLPRGIKLRTYF
ncbi:hypothetical protein R1flu_022464 [Riccia fluitans]|uniref:Endonuclease/exonuclease/phosphatase domain-containing protein n=1 Tax=Riccia fluitans TaxID=41844 RepID=A0ABD1XP94_9MARC